MLRPYTVSPAPSLPVSGLEVVLRDPGGEHRTRSGIHVDRLRRTDGQIAEQHHLCERPRMVGDVRPRRRAAFTRRDPFGVHAFGARVLLRNRMRRYLGLLGLIEQTRILTVNPGDEFSGIADPELAAGVEGPRQRIRDLLGPRRIEATVAPYHRHRRTTALRREAVGDARACRRRLGIELGGLRFDARRVAEIERPERRVHRMTGDVAERAGSEIPPAAPLEWRVGRIVGPLGYGTEPQIPVQGRGRMVLLEGTIDRLRPDGPVGPELDLPHRSDETRLDPLANQIGR